ncbi:MAG: circularly permuted type 2 ATP-grasp protein, partial [Bosea sp. (in: a-proteobacteria)]|nr:circularly permuted type 2 ATP-grasp protein [Bosea sp. (in: a-proteobacteria)]
MVAFNEMTGTEGDVRQAYAALDRWLKEAPPDMLALRRSQAELFFRRIGITFAVYGDEESTERLIPFDIIPRSIPASEWRVVERGC